MFIEERQREIAEAIQARGTITVGEICEKYGISEESARRDLRTLELKNLCKRTHGGAVSLSQVSVRPPAIRHYESMTVYDNYREIARRAASMIRENDIVYLTGGSFGYILLTYLPRTFPFTAVINNIDLAAGLRTFEKIEIYLAGGKMRQSGSLTDNLAADFVSRIHFDICFLTGSGLTADFGLSNGTAETSEFQRIVIKNSRKKCLLMPSGKVGKDSFIKVCDSDCFDTVITDWDCTEDELTALREKGLEVLVVQQPSAGSATG